MGNFIVIGILLLIAVMAVLRARKHFKGGCCGSGSTTIRDKKVLDAPKLGEKTLYIDGMHCENCEARVGNALDRLEGVASRVSWRKRTAMVSYSREIPDELLKAAVEKLGYKVTEIS